MFIKDKSYALKSDGIALKNNPENIKEFNPYSFTGKIVKKDNNQILLLTSFLNEIIILTNIKDEFN